MSTGNGIDTRTMSERELRRYKLAKHPYVAQSPEARLRQAEKRRAKLSPEERDMEDREQAERTAEALTTKREESGKPEWKAPDWSLLDDRRGKLPDFPVDVLTPEWQSWLHQAAHGAGVTPDHVITPLIVIAGSLIGTARRVRASRSFSQPLTHWGGVLGFSGTGKTPGISVTKRALALIGKSRKHKLDDLQRAHEKRAEASKVARAKWKAEVQEAIEAGAAAPEMPAQAMAAGEFIPPRLFATDATIERLAALLQARAQGMVMIVDELAGLFANMGRYSRGSDKEFWLEAWNGEHHVVERQGRPAVILEHLLIGICGGFQPDKLAAAFEGADDGMYARMLFAWPDEPGFRSLSDEVTEVEPVFQQALLRLVDLPAEGNDGSIVPRHLPLSDDARAAFEHFRQFLHRGKDALDGREREWWAKGATHVLRLAGTLCLLDWSMHGGDEPDKVADTFVRAAVRLWQDYYWPHARAALRQVGPSKRHANARRVLRWARAHKSPKSPVVSLMDVRRDALNQRLDADETKALLGELAKAGWCRKTTKKTDGRPLHRWEINPALWMQEVQEVQEA
jgi:uncharacterized protein DUF3987